MKIRCWNCNETHSDGASKDEFGWHGYCPKCDSSFDIDIEDYLIPNGTKVIFDGGKIGIVDGNDAENKKEYDEIKYCVCPIEFGKKEGRSNYHIMLFEKELEIIRS